MNTNRPLGSLEELLTQKQESMSPNKGHKKAIKGPEKETRAQRVAREKMEEKTSSDRKIAIRKLTKAITESSLSTQQIERMYEQFQEVTG